MTTPLLLLALFVLVAVAYRVGRRRAVSVAGGSRGLRRLHSLPGYYGGLAALWCALPALAVIAIWGACQDTLISRTVLAGLPAQYAGIPEHERSLFMNEVRNSVDGGAGGSHRPEVAAAAQHLRQLRSTSRMGVSVLALLVGAGGLLLIRKRIAVDLPARNQVEWIIRGLLMSCSTLAVFTTIGIVVSVLYESLRFFSQVPVLGFLFGTHWSPQMAMRADQVGASGAFGAVPLFAGTLMISAIAMTVAVPVGLFSAIYLAEYADRRFRALTKPVLELLAGIPTVVYGFFAALTVGPALRQFGDSLGLNVASESALAAGLVMGVMIIPFVSSLADDMLRAVPQALRDGSYGLGATRSETIRRVVLPAALPGIVGGVLLAISRAIGETMIVVMAAGLAAHLTANPFESVTTVTVQIVSLLVGDQEFDSPRTLAAFALGLVLFVATLILNIVALRVVRRYRERYD